jgi:hypothetical protein
VRQPSIDLRSAAPSADADLGLVVKRIWKYPLTFTELQTLKVPRGARPLSVDWQATDGLCLWMLVDDQAPMVYRGIYVVATGALVPDNVGEFIGTALEGAFVWHCFWEEER